jgi:chromosome segregation ATPase
VFQLEAMVHELKTQSMQADHETKQLHTEHARAKQDFDEAKARSPTTTQGSSAADVGSWFLQAKAVDLKLKAERLTGVLTDELKELFKDMPNTLDELNEAIEEARARAELSYLNNPQVITEYETRCEEINTLGEKLEAEQDQLKAEQAEIEKLKVCSFVAHHASRITHHASRITHTRACSPIVTGPMGSAARGAGGAHQRLVWQIF